jgi:hypothetical protein
MTIVPGRGRFLFDGTVPGMDQVDYRGQFVLRNLTNKACDVQVGFPVDSESARLSPGQEAEDQKWVFRYSFIARDPDSTYHVDFTHLQPKGPDGPFAAIFTWHMRFQPSETKTLTVQYRIPMSMTLYSTSRQEMTNQWHTPARPWVSTLQTCLLESAGYTTETGSSWAGNVEQATFTLLTDPFERYLDYREVVESSPDGLTAEEKQKLAAIAPVPHAWWFREIKPAGWQPVEGGIRWQHKDFKPIDPISARYYLVQLPRLSSDVDAWVDALLRGVPDEQKARDLAIIRQILLASYGQEPQDALARQFADDQVWYRPQKSFSFDKLTAQQHAVLKELDRRVELALKVRQ